MLHVVFGVLLSETLVTLAILQSAAALATPKLLGLLWNGHWPKSKPGNVTAPRWNLDICFASYAAPVLTVCTILILWQRRERLSKTFSVSHSWLHFSLLNPTLMYTNSNACKPNYSQKHYVLWILCFVHYFTLQTFPSRDWISPPKALLYLGLPAACRHKSFVLVITNKI